MLVPHICGLIMLSCACRSVEDISQLDISGMGKLQWTKLGIGIIYRNILQLPVSRDVANAILQDCICCGRYIPAMLSIYIDIIPYVAMYICVYDEST